MLESIESNHENKKEFFTTFYDKNNLDVFNNLVPFYGKIISNMMTDLGLEHISRYQYTVWMQMSNSSTTSHKPHAHFYRFRIYIMGSLCKCSKSKMFLF